LRNFPFPNYQNFPFQTIKIFLSKLSKFFSGNPGKLPTPSKRKEVIFQEFLSPLDAKK
jgi:hypothetical protein